MESTSQGNIVLGRDFLRDMKGFIDIGKGQIRLRGKPKGMYLFPRKKKNELTEEKFEGFNDSDDFCEFGFSLFASCLAQRYKRNRLWGGNPICFTFSF